jgi:7,8-dihydropterin-6-yl-methyl-4-(beta-D-ribofuranosyl)aminobenzene 5'-phosphate synthase
MSADGPVRITIVYDNEVRRRGLRPGWGFSCLVEVNGMSRILFDTGADGPTLLRNMKQLGLDPNAIDAVFISHGHFDHTGGLPQILEANPDAAVYFPASFSGSIRGRRAIAVRESTPICDNVYTTGELDGIEQSLLLVSDQGITVVVGCSHPGVGEIIDVASGYGTVKGLVGGLHGFREFARLDGLSLICPCHCTQHKSEIRRLFPGECIECGAGVVLEL